MRRGIKMILNVVLGIILAIIIVIIGYIAYMQFQYYRIEDNTKLEVGNNQSNILEKNKVYSIMTYNIGFGAYDHEYSFFMDTGVMADGTAVKGKYSRGRSKKAVKINTLGSLELAKSNEADFYFFQEVDEKATRSYKINQKEIFIENMKEYANTFANNFHAAYMAYPFNEPHGSVEAGLLTLSKYNIRESMRKSYPVDKSFFTKFFDLDRCFSVNRVEVKDGKELVLVNNHMSAYDEGGKIRSKQLELLNVFMNEEYKKGNYVIVGGDFNHCLGGKSTAFVSGQKVPDWIAELADNDIVSGMSIVYADNGKEIPTCRSCDIPYEKGVNYTSVIDGFIISDNIEATAKNIDSDFKYSDHNPVMMSFKLK